MRRLSEPEVGPYPTAIEAEWAFIYSVRPWLQMDDKCSDLGLHSAASFLRCGHVNIISDPSALKENVASGMGFFSQSGRIFVGSLRRSGSFFLTYEIAQRRGLRRFEIRPNTRRRMASRVNEP